jgi:hypothetical protein
MGRRTTRVLRSSASVGGTASRERPGAARSTSAASAARFSSTSVTSTPVANRTADRKFIEWWNHVRAKTTPSTSVAERQAGAPRAISPKSRFARAPWR